MGAGKALDRMEQDLGSDGAGRAYDQRELDGPRRLLGNLLQIAIKLGMS